MNSGDFEQKKECLDLRYRYMYDGRIKIILYSDHLNRRRSRRRRCRRRSHRHHHRYHHHHHHLVVVVVAVATK